MIGTSLKGYQIVEKIKEGSVGTVWKARNKNGELVALKILAERHVHRSDKRRYFKREATLAKRLDHPNIMYFPSENMKYTMKHYPERLYKKEFYILRQVAEALSYLHSEGIIHKDVKPENILVGDDSGARLIDFSLCETKTDRLLRLTKRIEGTPMYMAPEQIRGSKCDKRTDIYAFGIVMYYLLTKHPPFRAQKEQRLFEMHLREPAPPMNSHVKTISSDLENFVKKMLAKLPVNRYQSMTSVIYELYKWERKDTV
ncbi:MAG: serine/threonine protein kinase, partial [Planctomycetota bacterium]